MKNRWHSTIRPSRLRSQKLASIAEPKQPEAIPQYQRSPQSMSAASGMWPRTYPPSGVSRKLANGSPRRATNGSQYQSSNAPPSANYGHHAQTGRRTTTTNTSPVMTGRFPSSAKGKHQRRQPCNCRKSRCIKLYCECFAAGNFCRDCNCVDCSNLPTHKSVRQKAINGILQRNANAFDSRPAQAAVLNVKGCNCKKSGCKKKYCECFQRSVRCSTACQCRGCENQSSAYKSKAALMVLRGPAYSPAKPEMFPTAAQVAAAYPQLLWTPENSNGANGLPTHTQTQTQSQAEATAASVLSGLATPTKSPIRGNSGAFTGRFQANSPLRASSPAPAFSPVKRVFTTSSPDQYSSPRSMTSSPAEMLLQAAKALERRTRSSASAFPRALSLVLTTLTPLRHENVHAPVSKLSPQTPNRSKQSLVS